nr:hypothetical protein [Serratia marcescens]
MAIEVEASGNPGSIGAHLATKVVHGLDVQHFITTPRSHIKAAVRQLPHKPISPAILAAEPFHLLVKHRLENHIETAYIGVSLDIENYCTVSLFFEQTYL